MTPYAKDLDELQVHFILCTERSGSSLLSLMLNVSPQVLGPSEEPFAVYFYERYKDKTKWTERELQQYVDDFWLMAEQSLEIFFTTKEEFLQALIPHRNQLPYRNLVKLTYLQFIEPKPKEGLRMIVDKQVKFFFYLPLVCEIFPEAKFVVLVRDVRDNIVAKSARGLHESRDPVYLSAIWNFSYGALRYLDGNHRQVHVVRYEDLIRDTENTLIKLCKFLGIDFIPLMLDPAPVYENFLKLREAHADKTHLEYVRKFQSTLISGGIKPDKIGVYCAELDKKTEGKVLALNKHLFLHFGYEVDDGIFGNLSIADRVQMFRAWLRFPFLLKTYLALPLAIKLLIKKIRNKPRI